MSLFDELEEEGYTQVPYSAEVAEELGYKWARVTFSDKTNAIYMKKPDKEKWQVTLILSTGFALENFDTKQEAIDWAVASIQPNPLISQNLKGETTVLPSINILSATIREFPNV